MNKACYYLLLVIATAGLLVGCASSSADATHNDGPGGATSNIPWNKPASWEGNGALGSAMGQ